MIINSVLIFLIKGCIRFNMLFLILSVYPNPRKAFTVFQQIISLRQSGARNRKVKKFIRQGGKFHQAINLPGWPSSQFNRFIKNEIGRLGNSAYGTNRLQTVFFETTRLCRFNCKHCSIAHINADKSNGTMVMHEDVITKIKDAGIPHIQFTGGEPLEDFDNLVKLIKLTGKMESWVLSSGYELSEERARIIKKSGLTGVNISLDHWDEQEHNKFRGSKEAYSWARKAILNCKQAGLLVSVSLCATKEFTTKENLRKFVKLSQEWGVHFIRVLEPKQAGNFANRNIRLSAKQRLLLEEFYFSDECDKRDKLTPILMYPDLLNREKCCGKGERYIYVDIDGVVHPCPFCFTGTSNILEVDIESICTKLSKEDCINCNVYEGSLN